MKYLLPPRRELFRLCLVFALVASVSMAAFGSAAAQYMLNSNYRAAGDWQFTLTYSKTHAKSSWDATLKQDSHGNLKGRVEPSSIDCSAGITGTVRSKTIKMTWRVKTPCSNETVVLSGKASHHRMTGTFVDSRLGPGAFSGQQDS